MLFLFVRRFSFFFLGCAFRRAAIKEPVNEQPQPGALAEDDYDDADVANGDLRDAGADDRWSPTETISSATPLHPATPPAPNHSRDSALKAHAERHRSAATGVACAAALLFFWSF